MASTPPTAENNASNADTSTDTLPPRDHLDTAETLKEKILRQIPSQHKVEHDPARTR
ncbi:hypothetical protein V2A60_008820 [Cordyceps javanica]